MGKDQRNSSVRPTASSFVAIVVVWALVPHGFLRRELLNRDITANVWVCVCSAMVSRILFRLDIVVPT